MREQNNKALEMAQAAMKQMADQMTTIYKSNAATEKANVVTEDKKENVLPGFKQIKKKSKRKATEVSTRRRSQRCAKTATTSSTIRPNAAWN